MIEIFPSIKSFTPSIIDSKKIYQELLSSPITPPQETVFFYFYFIDIIESKENN